MTDTISIHSLVRGRTLFSQLSLRYIRHFNPLPRKRENHQPTAGAAVPIYFNPLPRKRENDTIKKALKTDIYFNPLPRKRENAEQFREFEREIISIHSLVRGRTLIRHTASRCALFQSTPS